MKSKQLSNGMACEPLISNPALNPDDLHAASRHVGRRLAPRYAARRQQKSGARVL